MKANKMRQKRKKRDNKPQNSEKLISKTKLFRNWETYSIVRNTIKSVGIEYKVSSQTVSVIYSIYSGNKETKHIAFGIANFSNVLKRLNMLIELGYVVKTFQGTTVDQVGAAAKPSLYEVTGLGLMICRKVDKLVIEHTERLNNPVKKRKK